MKVTRPRAFLAASLLASAAAAVVVLLVQPGGVITFRGDFKTGLTPWKSLRGGAQCANYGTPSINRRLRGNLYFTTVAGMAAGEFYLPTDPNPARYRLETCGVNDGRHALVLPKDVYYGVAVYIPVGFKIPCACNYTNILEVHFQDVGGQPPLSIVLQNNASAKFEMAVGAYSPSSGFQYGSGETPALKNLYAIPPGGLVQGTWNQIAFHVHWAADRTGAVASYYKTVSESSWKKGASWTGYPTISWNAPNNFVTGYTDNMINYTGALTAPFSLYLTDELQATSLAAVEAAMP